MSLVVQNFYAVNPIINNSISGDSLKQLACSVVYTLNSELQWNPLLRPPLGKEILEGCPYLRDNTSRQQCGLSKESVLTSGVAVKRGSVLSKCTFIVHNDRSSKQCL